MSVGPRLPLTAPALDRFEASAPAPPDLRELARSLGPRPLDSVEFKLLLAPERFADAGDGLDSFWKRLADTVESLGLQAERTDDGDSKRRTIEYLDTGDFALRDQGYILRSRTSVKAKPVLALKYRDADRTKAAAADVSVREGLESEGKFEKDVTSSKQLFASSNKVKLKKLPPATLAGYSDVFPGLAGLGLASSAALQPVRGRHINEEVHDLAEIELGSGVKSLAQISLWYEDDRPVIAELSFNLPGQSPAAEEKGQRLLRALHNQAGEWLGNGTTKTEYVYSPIAKS